MNGGNLTLCLLIWNHYSLLLKVGKILNQETTLRGSSKLTYILYAEYAYI
jgi:hypothetical protein